MAGPWTLCATVTESPQTLFFAPGTPLVAAVAGGLGGHPAGVISQTLRQQQDGQAVFTLWKAAIEAGGPANITMALVRAGAWSPAAPAAANAITRSGDTPGRLTHTLIAAVPNRRRRAAVR